MIEKIALKVPNGDGGFYEMEPLRGMPDSGFTDLERMLKWGTTALLVGAALLALLFLIWGGIEWITSAGNKEKLQAAQKKIIYASIGLVISLSAFFIINVVGDLFGVNFFG